MNVIKKTILTLLIAVMGIGVADAQFRFGIKAGLNVNNLRVSDLNEIKDNAAGFTGGVMTEFQVPLIGLCFDLSLMYTRMNSEFNYMESNLEGESLEQNKNFLELPLNIKYKFSLPVVGSIISPYIFTGPDFAFKLGKNTLSDFKTKTCQIAWNVGLGVELVKHLQVGASYGFGINNIAKKLPLGLNPEDNGIKNNYWTVTAAYLF
ncbi:MAG: PorT family protein [Muribaculaceae bacterium]|nr:PorT family protein [Muribaculaceae bacterium]